MNSTDLDACIKYFSKLKWELLADVGPWDVCGLYGPLFVGGSVRVNQDAANDFDIFMSSDLYTKITPGVLGAHGLGLAIHEDQEGYGLECDLGRYICDYRHRDLPVNLIILNAFYVPSYHEAVKEMLQNPSEYATKESRIELHKRLCNEARLNADPSCIHKEYTNF